MCRNSIVAQKMNVMRRNDAQPELLKLATQNNKDY
jgi:hypothetical protein